MWQARSQKGLGVVSERQAGKTWVRLGWIVCLPAWLGCDPVLSIDGAFFPGWMLCLIIGIGLAFAAHPVFVRWGIEGEMGPPVLIYPCLALLFTLATWLIFFRT